MKNVVKPRRLFEEPEAVEQYLDVHTELKSFIAEVEKTPRPPFQPGVIYSRIGDFFEVYWEDVPCYAERCGDVDLMKEHTTGRVVGVQFFGAKKRMGLREVKEGQ